MSAKLAEWRDRNDKQMNYCLTNIDRIQNSKFIRIDSRQHSKAWDNAVADHKNIIPLQNTDMLISARAAKAWMGREEIKPSGAIVALIQ